MTEVRLSNETGELQTQTLLITLRVLLCLSSTSSFPEDCARLKLSSARASQAGLKEMMMQTKSEGFSERNNLKLKLT